MNISSLDSVLQNWVVIDLGAYKWGKIGQKRWIWGGRAGWADSFPVLRSRDRRPRQIQFLAPKITLFGPDCYQNKFLIFENRFSEAESSPWIVSAGHTGGSWCWDRVQLHCWIIGDNIGAGPREISAKRERLASICGARQAPECHCWGREAAYQEKPWAGKLNKVTLENPLFKIY